MAKSLLPRFGGSASVWITCMLFFQVVLLLGYLYSFCLTRYLGGKAQALAHLALLTLSTRALPLNVRAEAIGGSPTAAILFLLASSVGVPYFALSRHGPLLQSWLAAPRGTAASHTGSSRFPTPLHCWPCWRTRWPSSRSSPRASKWPTGRAAYLALLVLLARCRGWQSVPNASGGSPAAHRLRTSPMALDRARRLRLHFVAGHGELSRTAGGRRCRSSGSCRWRFICLSFILCFEADGWYRPSLFRWLMPVAWIAICSRTRWKARPAGCDGRSRYFPSALFICCMFCHGELARSKPAPQDGLAFFYLMVALGGAAGRRFRRPDRSESLPHASWSFRSALRRRSSWRSTSSSDTVRRGD